jgi:hypothetical protein
VEGSASDTIKLEGVIQRKSPSLPRYVELPSSCLRGWNLQGTTPVELAIDGVAVGRRHLKAWGRGRDCWFIDLPEAACRQAGCDTGDQVKLTLRRASETLPEELSALLERDAAARACWQALNASRRRILTEHVRAAKQTATRVRRAARGLLGSS